MREHLELAIFTYKRADALRQTLAQLEHSPVADCRLTVLDNASPDHTPEVCAEFAGRFRDLRVVRHERNIGAGPNYLRAVELAEAPYTWVLCDDDIFDFSRSDDVLDAIRSGGPDLISLGAPGRPPELRGTLTTAGALARADTNYFQVFTFVPNTIFRSKLFDTRCLARGYRNVDNLYPHWEFVVQAAVHDRSVLFSQADVVSREVVHETQSTGSTMYWIAAWMRSCATIEDPELRRSAIGDLAPDRVSWLRQLGGNIARERLEHPERLTSELADVLLTARGYERVATLVALWMAVLPRPLVRWMLEQRLGGAHSGPREFDPLRL